MNLGGRIKRMDSMMIESNIRFLSRMELICTCISKLAIYFDKNYPEIGKQIEEKKVLDEELGNKILEIRTHRRDNRKPKDLYRRV